mmetsp:Transcript_107123/g.298346  ORF Transcript_107123/g.298346 Transcript_107123/m.298346 type:complete len:389 (+) Transcript_107123:57-1223(+)
MGAVQCKCRETGEDEAPAEIVDEHTTVETSRSMTPRTKRPVPITVAIAGARGLRNATWMERHALGGAPEDTCTCIVEATGSHGSVHLSTAPCQDTVVPVWKTTVSFAEYMAGTQLLFSIVDKGGCDLGRATLEAQAFKASGFNGELELETVTEDTQAFLKVKVRHDYNDWTLLAEGPGESLAMESFTLDATRKQEDFPSGLPPQFTLSVTKSAAGSPVGLDVDIQDGMYVHVVAVTPGPFNDYNDSVEPAHHMQGGDFIEAVNGISHATAKMLSELKTVKQLELTVRRPEEFHFLVARRHSTQPLGLDFPKKIVGTALLIMEIRDGAVKEFNESRHGDGLRVGDRIIAANGKSGQATALLSAIQHAQRVHLTILRPSVSTDTAAYMYW